MKEVAVSARSINVAGTPIELPPAPLPVGNYARVAGSAGFHLLSGQLPFRDGRILYPGRLGDSLTLDQGRAAARQAALNALAHIHALTDGFRRLERLLRMDGYVACAPDFFDHPAVLDAASDLFVEALGERGVHARGAVGVQSLPGGAAVELLIGFKMDDEEEWC
jgi:enamine deaminase RidA (YjgF/YER057c/UK114 family)